MKFTGTLIEDLMATVERAEQRLQANGALPVEAAAVEAFFVETSLAESSLVDHWFASVQENADYDSKLFGVA